MTHTITTERRDAAADAMARHVGWQSGSIAALDAVLATLGVTVSDEPTAAEGDVIERAARVIAEAHDPCDMDGCDARHYHPLGIAKALVAAGLLRTEPDDAAERIEEDTTDGR